MPKSIGAAVAVEWNRFWAGTQRCGARPGRKGNEGTLREHVWIGNRHRPDGFRTTINGMISDTDAYQKRVFAALMGGCECKAPLGVIGGCSCTKRCAAGFVMFAPHYTERVAWPTADQQRQWCGGESDDDDGE